MILQNPCSWTPAMGSPAAFTHIFSSSSSSSSSLGIVISSPSQTFLKPPNFPLQTPLLLKTFGTPFIKHTNHHLLKTPITITRATLDEKDQNITTPVPVQEEKEEPNEVCVVISFGISFICSYDQFTTTPFAG